MNIKWTDKTQAITTGAVAAVMGFIGWLAAIPPEQQSGVLGSLVSVFPLTWQPAIGLWAKSLSTLLGIWAVYKAAHSGPQTPPKNPPQ